MQVNKGSIETMVVDVKDVLGTLAVLPASTRYHILDTDGNSELANQVPTISGLQAQCVIDSTTLDIDDYDLFLSFNQAPDTPRLGPFRFRVV
jgi:hypothetical protein